MHTDTTLKIMDAITGSLGKDLRKFSETTCAAYNTKELKREAEARKRRAAAKQKKKGHSAATGNPPLPASDQPDGNSRQGILSEEAPASKDQPLKLKKFSLNTYKLHALGDYPSTIREYGTTDSYSTEVVRF